MQAFLISPLDKYGCCGGWGAETPCLLGSAPEASFCKRHISSQLKKPPLPRHIHRCARHAKPSSSGFYLHPSILISLHVPCLLHLSSIPHSSQAELLTVSRCLSCGLLAQGLGLCPDDSSSLPQPHMPSRVSSVFDSVKSLSFRESLCLFTLFSIHRCQRFIKGIYLFIPFFLSPSQKQ